MANRAFFVLRSAIKVSGRGVYYPTAFRMRRLAAFYNHSAACVCAVLPMVCLIELPAFGRRMAGSRDYDRCFVGYLYAAISILEPHIAAVAGIVGLCYRRRIHAFPRPLCCDSVRIHANARFRPYSKR